MKKSEKKLLIITAIFFVFMIIIGLIAWNAGEYRKACVTECLKELNLSFIESDYFSKNCYCVYKFNDTKISIKGVNTNFSLGPFL